MYYIILRPCVAYMLLCPSIRDEIRSNSKCACPGLVIMAMIILIMPPPLFAKNSPWNLWLESQIEQHPDVIAAREQWLGSNARAYANEQSRFNPELFTELERNGDVENYRVGIQQTIDWWGISGVKQQQAVHMRNAAKALYEQEVLDKTAEALTALVEWRAAKRTADVAQVQQQQLDALLELVEKRQQAGDLGSVDAELTFLSLSQQLAQVAEVEAALQKAETRVHELLPEWSPGAQRHS